MAMTKKGPHLVTIDGQAYRWRIRRVSVQNQTKAQGSLTVAIERFDAPGVVLFLDLDQPQMDPSKHPSRKANISSEAITQIIRTAFNAGWLSDSFDGKFPLPNSHQDEQQPGNSQ